MSDPVDKRLRTERDLYRDLLRLGAASDPRPFLEEALRRVVAAAGSHQGYLALYRGQDLGSEPDFWIAHDCTEEEVARVRANLSRGIVREAVDRGETISTACALEDPRFREQESVAVQGIRAVLCAPVAGALGVIYLQGKDQPGPSSGDCYRRHWTPRAGTCQPPPENWTCHAPTSTSCCAPWTSRGREEASDALPRGSSSRQGWRRTEPPPRRRPGSFSPPAGPRWPAPRHHAAEAAPAPVRGTARGRRGPGRPHQPRQLFIGRQR